MKKRTFETGFFQGMGEHETGCHTVAGNDLCLYVQTTESLASKMNKIFKDLLNGKLRWTGATEFSVVMRLEKPAQTLYIEATDLYQKEIRPFAFSVTTYEDFLLWMVRSYDQYEIEAAYHPQIPER